MEHTSPLPRWLHRASEETEPPASSAAGCTPVVPRFEEAREDPWLIFVDDDERPAPPPRVLARDLRALAPPERWIIAAKPERAMAWRMAGAARVLAHPLRPGSAFGLLVPFVELCRISPSAIAAVLVGAIPRLAPSPLVQAAEHASRLAAREPSRVVLVTSRLCVPLARGLVIPRPRPDGLCGVERFVKLPRAPLSLALLRAALSFEGLLASTAGAMLSLYERTLGVPLDLLSHALGDESARSFLFRGLHEATPQPDFGFDVLQAAPELLLVVSSG